MKKLILFAGVVALSGCMGKAPEAEESAAAEAPATEAVAAAAPAPSPTPGSYDVTNPDGTTAVDTLMADGTFVSRNAADEVTDKGTWAVKDGKTCFTGEDKTENCFTEGARAADGSFAATGADGKITQVKPRAM